MNACKERGTAREKAQRQNEHGANMAQTSSSEEMAYSAEGETGFQLRQGGPSGALTQRVLYGRKA